MPFWFPDACVRLGSRARVPYLAAAGRTCPHALFRSPGSRPGSFFVPFLSMASVEEMRAVVQKKVEPELTFIWDDLDIDIKYQHALALKKITLSRFG